jgi:hypothetical protein
MDLAFDNIADLTTIFIDIDMEDVDEWISELIMDILIEFNELYDRIHNFPTLENLDENWSSELDELEYDDPENPNNKSFFFNTEQDAEEQIESCLQLMHDYILENPTEMAEPDFEEAMIDELKDLIENQYNTFFWLAADKEIFDAELEEIIGYALSLFYIYFMPPRSYPTTYPIHFLEKWSKITEQQTEQQLTNKLRDLKEAPQPAQRTKEWYAFRYNLITASNAYKAMDQSQSVQNQLIYEKCSATNPPLENPPLEKVESNMSSSVETEVKVITFAPLLPKVEKVAVNIHSPMHWGQKYEPVSVLLYEDMYDTKVGDYGCIKHRTYSFLGASPDGINDVLSDNGKGNGRYGRMLEIKNIVNREIDGIPKKEYWIQMQLQMETCDLDECDFLETRFKEIEEEEYLEEQKEIKEDPDDTPSQGIIIYFASMDGNPFYVYKPLRMIHQYFEDIWLNEKIEEQQKCGRCWIKNIFWKLEEYSCVLVLRNQLWFNENIGALERLWNIVLKERETGEWTSRGPQKRVKKEKEADKVDKVNVKFDKVTGKFISL